EVSGGVLDIDLRLPVLSDAQYSRGLVAAAEEIAAIIEGDAVGQAGQVGGEGRSLAGASVRRDSDPRDPPRKGFADVKRAARCVERHAVGEDQRLVVPELSFPRRQVVGPDARTGRRKVVAVGNQQPDRKSVV